MKKNEEMVANYHMQILGLGSQEPRTCEGGWCLANTFVQSDTDGVRWLGK